MTFHDAFDVIDSARRIFTWGTLAIAIIVYLWRGLGFVRLRGFLAAATIFAVAMLPRWFLPAWAPLHANDHGIQEVGLILGSSCTENSPFYGIGYCQAASVAAHVLGHTAASVFGFAAITGSFACVALFFAGRRISGSTFGGFVAAMGLALHPAFVRLSTSESPWPLALLLFFSALVAGLAVLDAPAGDASAGALAWIAGSTLAIALEFHVSTLVLPADAFLVIALASRARVANGQWPSWRPFRLPTALVVLTVMCHIAALQGAYPALSRRTTNIGFPLPAEADALEDPTLSPALLVPGAVIGAFALGSPLAAVPVSIGFLSIEIPASAVASCRTDLIRYQTAAHAFLYLALAGLGAFSVGSAWRTFVVLALLGLGLADDCRGLTALRTRTLDEGAFELFARRFAELPSRIDVVTPERDNDSTVNAVFPAYLASQNGRVVTEVTGWDARPSRSDGSRQCFIYLGPACYRFASAGLAVDAVLHLPANLVDPMRPQCVQLASHADLASERAIAQRFPVPWRIEEYQPIPARGPLVGLFPCLE